MSVPTSRDSDKFVLRLPDGMRDQIKAAAEANNRSMNAEIVARLEASFRGPGTSFVSTDLSVALRQLAVQLEKATETYRSPEFAESMRVLATRMNPKDD